MAILTLTVIIDIFSANKFIYLNYLTHLGVLFLIFSQSFILSSRFASVFLDNRKLSGKLKEKNLALKLLVNQQAKSVDEFKVKKRGVHAMTLALDYWKKSTGLSKADFADRSGIWTVYINQNGFERTQTLDKYLSTKLFPKKPRWNNIIETIEFVLDECDTVLPEREELIKIMKELKILI